MWCGECRMHGACGILLRAAAKHPRPWCSGCSHEERSMQHAVAWVLGDCVSTRLVARGRVSAMASGRHVHNSCTRGAADATGSHGEGPVRHHGSLRHGSLQVSDDKSVVRLARAGWPAAAPNLWSSVSSYFLACLPRGCAGTSTKRWCSVRGEDQGSFARPCAAWGLARLRKDRCL
jgi:hypothetical protein